MELIWAGTVNDKETEFIFNFKQNLTSTLSDIDILRKQHCSSYLSLFCVPSGLGVTCFKVYIEHYYCCCFTPYKKYHMSYVQYPVLNDA